MNKLVFLETMIIGAGSIIVGIVFGFFIFKILFHDCAGDFAFG
ncbi:hypothetical protein OL548_32850 [Lysinibacillus sp. MHQ-1]|nr:hypothetical protein OL548_32850 [Lysinibacillus sp. MHQ-1]